MNNLYPNTFYTYYCW